MGAATPAGPAETSAGLGPKFDPLDPDLIADPYPRYAELRATAPVCRSGIGTWMVFRHADVSALLSDPRLGNQRQTPEPATPLFGPGPAGALSQRIIAGRDGAEHKALRAVLTHSLSAARSRLWQPRVAELVDLLLGPALDGEPLDAVAGLAFPLQALVVCELLGLPAADRERIWPTAMTLGRTFIPYRMPTPEAVADADAAVAELRGYIAEHFDRRLRSPGDDLTSRFAAELDPGAAGSGGLTREDLVDNLVFLLFAGFEPSMNMVANGVSALLAHPGQWRRLVADAALVPSAVDEFLRYDAPTQYTMRLAREPLTVAGRKIHAGRLLLLVLGSANRDPERFPDPDRLDVGRTPNPQLSFGGGGHHCTGWALAKAEGAAVFGRLRDRFTGLEPAGDAVRLDHPNFRAHVTLPVRLRAR